MMRPSASTLTTEGHSVLPCGPGIHFGAPVCGSVYATRLFVVPRSIPTILPMFAVARVLRKKASGLKAWATAAQLQRTESQQFLLDFVHQVADVRPAIQQLV